MNEAGARFPGFPSNQNALGQRHTAHYHEETKWIIGVVKDFHYRGMLLAFGSVAFQGIRAALRNPVDTLPTEE